MTGMRKPFGYISMLWSDIGSTGFEAVGDLDSSLDTVAFWDRVGINAQGAPWYFNSPPATPVDYGKGVVYYLKNKRVVGVLLWNVHGQIPACRQIIASQKQLSAEELKDAIKF
jgi:programmed cell death 8 (apoptosis-inducing factor)